MAIQPATYNFVVQRRADHSITLVFKDSNNKKVEAKKSPTKKTSVKSAKSKPKTKKVSKK